MKLIIDIPEERYKHIQEEQWLPNRLLIEKAIANGIPLDKIRAEIASYKDDKVIHAERNEMIDIVLAIIDKYTKGAEE